MMKKLTLLLLLVVPFFCYAQAYKHVDKTGKITYSDENINGAEKITLPKVQTYQAPAVSQDFINSMRDNEETNDTELAYSEIKIIHPEKDAWLSPGEKEIEVLIETVPRLYREHYLVLMLDDARVLNPSKNLSYKIDELARGEHTLQAIVTDENGKETEYKSEKITIFQFRPSVNFPVSK